MGGHGSVVRYQLRSGRTEAFLDVFSTREYGRLTEYCCGLWYATAPPPDVEKQFISSAGVIKQVAEMGNQYSPPERSGGSGLARPSLAVAHPIGSAVVYQAVYLIASRDPKAPENVAAPQPPTFRTGVLAPLTALIQDHAALHTPTPYDTSSLAALTDTILSSAKGAPGL